MEKYRNKKILTIIVLMIAIAGLSIGFATFSSVLQISSEVMVDPDASTFSVKFSKIAGSIADGENNLIYPTGNGEAGLIDNTTDPTLTGLKANFTAPGQTVQYKLYVMNTGEYLAYLNGVQILPKTCSHASGTNPTLVQNACEDIYVSVKIGTMDEITETNTNITNHTLAAGAYEEVIVTINYKENGAVADGPFDVNFGDVKLTYSTITGFDVPTDGGKVCTLQKELDGETITTDASIKTEIVTCGSEQFYVMDRNSSTITMLTKYNLSTSTSPYLQDTTGAINPVWFSETSMEGYDMNNRYPNDLYVYNSNTIIYPYVYAYENYLKNTLKMTTASATLMSIEQAQTLLGYYENEIGYWPSDATPSWVYSTSYWLGSGELSVYEIGNGIDSYSGTIHHTPGYDDGYGASSNHGIRPVITISTSQVNM